MPLYRVTLAYDGTDFAGWQLQRLGKGRTVQGVLEGVLARMAGGVRVAILAAGRTDAGAHALGQVATFDLPRELPADELQRALNGMLPDDVRVLETTLAAPGFHPRRDAVSKVYRYELDCGGVQPPQRRRTAAFVPWRLAEDAVREAAALYLGRNDFASLASAGGSAKTTVRTVVRSDVAFSGPTLLYETEADGFLRKMVRSMVGGLIAAGRGTTRVEDLARALDSRDRRAWPAPAPACGLTLVRVTYPPRPPMLG